MITKQGIVFGLVSGVIFIGGCAGPSRLSQNWGRSVETAKYNQTLNPEAGKECRPVEGLDGKRAIKSLGCNDDGQNNKVMLRSIAPNK